MFASMRAAEPARGAHSATAAERRFERAELYIFSVILLLAALLRGALQYTNGLVMWPDAHAYLVSALRIARYGDVLTHEAYRTPLYSLWVAPFLSWFGITPLAGEMLAAAQHALGLLSIVLVYLISKREFGVRQAQAGMSAAAAYPMLAYYEHVGQTEVLFAPLLLLLVWLALRPGAPSLGRCLAVGVCAAMLTLTRPIAQYLVFVVIAAWAWQYGRKAALPSVLCGLIFAGVLWPWIVINQRTHGAATVSCDLGLNLFHKAFDVAGLEPPLKRSAVGHLYRQIRETHAVTYFKVYDALRVGGRSAVEADTKMRRFALAAILAHPLSYLWNSAETLFRLLIVPRNSIEVMEGRLREMSVDPRFLPLSGKDTARQTFVPWLLRTVSYVFEPLLAVAAVIGAVRLFRARRWTPERLAPAFMALYLLIITAALNREEDRFRLPVDLLLLPLVAAAVCRPEGNSEAEAAPVPEQ